jgi:WD40 repeat protein
VYSCDGKRIATASEDNTVRIWDAENYRLLAVITGQSNEVNLAARSGTYSLEFSADGTRIVTAGASYTARVCVIDFPGLLQWAARHFPKKVQGNVNAL